MADVTLVQYGIRTAQFAFRFKENRPFGLNMECTAEIREPSDGWGNTALISAELSLGIPESDELSIRIGADFVFAFDPLPADFRRSSEELCLPIVQDELFRVIDRSLEAMGYPPLDLSVERLQRKSE